MPGPAAVTSIVEGRSRDLGGFSVRRVLPAPLQRSVGPFVFFDELGPRDFPPGHGIDVRPHPHIALATVTYVFDGAILHRDSLGSNRVIRPGDVNWMIAGHGIAHSERTPPGVRESGGRLHAIQTWVALPQADEEMGPCFEHHPRTTLPEIQLPGATLRVIAGNAYGAESKVSVRSPTLYVHARLDAGAALPIPNEHEERAAYVVSGSIECDGTAYGSGTLVVLRSGADVALDARAAAEIMLVGGAALDGPRHIWWNFVSSSKERIERAKADWREGRFAKVPGDEIEFIPLPEE